MSCSVLLFCAERVHCDHELLTCVQCCCSILSREKSNLRKYTAPDLQEMGVQLEAALQAAGEARAEKEALVAERTLLILHLQARQGSCEKRRENTGFIIRQWTRKRQLGTSQWEAKQSLFIFFHAVTYVCWQECRKTIYKHVPFIRESHSQSTLTDAQLLF